MAHHSSELSDISKQLRETLGIGPTGQFPRGKIEEQDEGELQYAVAADPASGVVRIEFGKPVAWLALTPEQAEGLMESIQAKVWELRGIK